MAARRSQKNDDATRSAGSPYIRIELPTRSVSVSDNGRSAAIVQWDLQPAVRAAYVIGALQLRGLHKPSFQV